MRIIDWKKHFEKVFDGYYKHMRLEAPFRYIRLDEQTRKTGKK